MAAMRANAPSCGRRPGAILAMLWATAAAVPLGCKGDPHADVDGVEPARVSALSEHFREAGVGEGGLTLTAAMPDDFPPTLRIYPGSHVTLGGKQTTPVGKRSWSLTVETADPKEAVRAYYKANMPGLTPTSDIDLGDSELSVWRSDTLDVDLVVGRGADGKTTVTLDAVER
jgi:hypothetical protein